MYYYTLYRHLEWRDRKTFTYNFDTNKRAKISYQTQGLPICSLAISSIYHRMYAITISKGFNFTFNLCLKLISVRGYTIEGFISMCVIVVIELAKVLICLHITTQYIWCAATRCVTDIRIIRSDPNVQISLTISVPSSIV